MDRIDSFDGPYRFLSNFWPAPIRLRDGIYPTVEHAYQACKTLDPVARDRIRTVRTPGQAKRLGRHVSIRLGWDADKRIIMEALVRAKFNHEPLRSMLLATGDAELVEGNTWNDTYWGVCRGRGENHLGKILMKIREELRSKVCATSNSSAG